MTYRNDVDALAAREAALAKELAAKAKERDEVGRLLAEAKAKEAAEEKARALAAEARARRRWRIQMPMLIAVWSTGIVYFVTSQPEDGSDHDGVVMATHHVYSCDEIRPDYDRANAQTAQAYTAALAQKGLVPANLEQVQLGGGWSRR